MSPPLTKTQASRQIFFTPTGKEPGRGDIKLATYLTVLALLFGLELLTGCASTPPVTPETARTPTIDIGDAHRRALQQMDREDWHAARNTLATITGQDPARPGPWTNLGITLTMLGDRNGAEAAFKAAIDANHRAIEAYNQLGMLYRRHGQLDEARFIYTEALKLDPDNSNLHWNLAILHDRYLPDPRSALHHYQRYRQLTGSDDARLLAWIAEQEKLSQGDIMTARAKP